MPPMGVDEVRYRAAEAALWRAEGVTPTEERVRLPRLDTDVRVQVVGDGPPVLFLHGVANAGTSWAPLAARLPGFRCLLLDRPGCGLSPVAARATTTPDAFGSFAETLAVDVLDALGIETGALVATSLGGYVALRSLAASPARLTSAVLLGWTVGAPVGHTPLLMRITATPRVGRLLTKLPVSRRMARSMLAQVGLRQALDAGRVPPEAVDWFRSLLNDTDTMRHDIDATPPVLDLRHGMDDSLLLPPDLLASIQVPLLFLWGAADPFGGPDVAGRFVAQVPTARLELVPGAGHAVWMDDPDGIAQSVRTFLTATGPV